MAWQLQEAKQRFSQLVRLALDDGPRVVTRRGEEVVVVLSAAEFKRISNGVPDLRDYLLSGPDLSALDLERSGALARAVEL